MVSSERLPCGYCGMTTLHTPASSDVVCCSACMTAQPPSSWNNAAGLSLVEMDKDPLHEEAKKAILERGRASAVVLQRVLGIGYPRAIAILDALTTEGALGPDTPAGAREIRFGPGVTP